MSANKRLWIILLSSRVKEGSGPIKNLGEDLVVLPFSPSRNSFSKCSPPPTEFVVYAGGEHIDAATVDADHIAGEGGPRRHRKALIL